MSDLADNSQRPHSAIDASTINVPSTSPSSEERDQSSAAHHPAISAGKRLLDALWLSPDRCHQIGILNKQNNKFLNIPVKDTAEAVALAQKHSGEGTEVYFACAEYLTPDSRTAANASGACGFYLDVDCGEDKAVAGKGYASIQDAKESLDAFCQKSGLPKPTHVVHSGGGLHPHWALDNAIPRDVWQAYARQLKALTKSCGFLADDSRTADIASVLRIPDTLNHKFTPPRHVTLEYAFEEPIEQSVMLEAIAGAHARLCCTVVTKPSGHRSVVACTATTTGNVHANIYGPPDLEKLSSALVMLDPDCVEETWKLRRIAPIAESARHYPDMEIELYELARAWSSGELRGKVSIKWCTPGGNGLTGEQVFDEIWLRFLTSNYPGVPTRLGTVYHHAILAGWNPDDQFQVITAAAGEDE